MTLNMQSEYALKTYYQCISQHMSIPEIINNGIGITDEIRNIKSVDLLSSLINIKNILFKDGFNDKEEFGLKSSLYYALMNIADNEPCKVITCLHNCLNDSQINDRDKAFCNSILKDIDNMLERKDDVPWSLQDVKRWLKKNADLI